VVVRVGRYGPYLQRSVVGQEPGEDDRTALPEGMAPDELSVAKVDELFLGGGGERKLGEHPQTGEPVVIKSGRFGPYVSSGDRNASLLGSQTPDGVSLADALRLLSLPRLLGSDAQGVEVFAGAGRYGPYVKRGEEFRSLAEESQLFTVSLDEALALLAAPKTRARRAAAPPLRELGPDPLTDKPLVIKDGRFGPYVTDGEVNASLRRGQTPETLSVEQGSEMLAEKRANGPAPARKKTAAKKAPAKKTTTAKKTTAKKTTAKATTTAAKKTTAAKTTAAKTTTAAKKTAAKKAAPSKTTAAKKAAAKKTT
jgi:DNA topoisomerase-1